MARAKATKGIENEHKKGLWTEEEDKILIDYVEAHGKGKWNTIFKRTGLRRCGKSCRLRWMNYLSPDVKRDSFSEEEEDLIIRLHKLLGNRWSLIAKRVPGRTDNQVKNYWNTHLSKKLGVKAQSAGSSTSASSKSSRPLSTYTCPRSTSSLDTVSERGSVKKPDEGARLDRAKCDTRERTDRDHMMNHFWDFESELGTIENCGRISLPHPDDFSKALSTFDIGQNNLAFGLQNVTVDQIVAAIPGILDGFDAAAQELYGKGARFFCIHNTGPVGCLPFMALPYNGTLDQNGCVAYQNIVVQEFNQQLKERVNQLRNNLSMVAFTYVNVYSAKLVLISDAKNQGSVNPLNYCCGSFMPTFATSGLLAQVNGTTIRGDACGDPQDRISWDGIHFTDAANSWVASRIVNGSMSDPPVPISNSFP